MSGLAGSPANGKMERGATPAVVLLSTKASAKASPSPHAEKYNKESLSLFLSSSDGRRLWHRDYCFVGKTV
jgi:hypothetical protein